MCRRCGRWLLYFKKAAPSRSEVHDTTRRARGREGLKKCVLQQFAPKAHNSGPAIPSRSAAKRTGLVCKSSRTSLRPLQHIAGVRAGQTH